MIIFEDKNWSVSAETKKDGHLSVISGDLDVEWHLKVKANHLKAVKSAVRTYLGLQTADRKKEPDLIEMLRLSYASPGANSANFLARLLSKNEIPFEDEKWGTL